MSRNRRGHRGGRKHRHNQNNGSQTFQNQSNNSQVYVPKDPFVRNGSKPRNPKKRSFWSFLKFVYNCWFVLVRSCAFLPVFTAFNLGMLLVVMTGCRKGDDEFLGLSEFWDAVEPKPY